ncbi:MAG: hypothetical protein P4L65_03710 [Legionella sp.]|nr:hypothetical protein [Legionella sp.]
MSLKRIALGALIASLLLAGAAAVSLFLLPATLAAVAAYSVYGLTVAGLVGANALVQIGAIAALTAAASFVAALSFAGITNAFSAVANYFSKKSPAAGVVVEPAATFGAGAAVSSTAAMSRRFELNPTPANEDGLESDDEFDAAKAPAPTAPTAPLAPVAVPLVLVPAVPAVPAAPTAEQEEEEKKSAPSMNGQ